MNFRKHISFGKVFAGILLVALVFGIGLSNSQSSYSQEKFNPFQCNVSPNSWFGDVNEYLGFKQNKTFVWLEDLQDDLEKHSIEVEWEYQDGFVLLSNEKLTEYIVQLQAYDVLYVYENYLGNRIDTEFFLGHFEAVRELIKHQLDIIHIKREQFFSPSMLDDYSPNWDKKTRNRFLDEAMTYYEEFRIGKIFLNMAEFTLNENDILRAQSLFEGTLEEIKIFSKFEMDILNNGEVSPLNYFNIPRELIPLIDVYVSISTIPEQYFE